MQPNPTQAKPGLSAVKPSSAAEPSAVKPSQRARKQAGQPVVGGGGENEKYKLTVRLSHSVAMELKLFCAFRRRRLAEVVEAAVSQYLSRQQAVDDLDDDVLHSERANIIINLYTELTGNKWKRSDWRAYNRVKSIAPEIVEMAMRLARLRAATPIRSFAYFVPEILNPNYAKMKVPADYIRYLRLKFEALKAKQEEGQ